MNSDRKEKRRRSREQYESDIEPQAGFNQVYVALMASSGALAAVAFTVDSIPILIGSMVIAPVLPPITLMAVGLANRNIRSVFKGFLITVAGLLVALLFTTGVTWVMNFTGMEPTEVRVSPILEERINPGWYSVVAAIAAGVGGALAVSRKKQDTLVGVVASVALVPTVGAAGIAAMAHDWDGVSGGILMLGINVALITILGWIVFTFSNASA